MKENRDLSCERFVIQLDLTTSDAVADEVVELPFDAFPIFAFNQKPLECKMIMIVIIFSKL